MTLEEFRKKAKKIPDAPGVYYFLGRRKEVLYIGKATSLRDRTRSYFAPDLRETRGALLVDMLTRARSLDWRATDSVLEAMILEANLIRSHKPHYNSIQKDDKSFNYVVITKEDFPRVLVVRGRVLDDEFPPKNRLYCFGPFPHGLQLREAMKLIRRIFPYRENCMPADELIARGKRPRPCFNEHLRLCPGVCTGKVDKAEYRRIVRHIALLFQGKKKQLVRELEREMKNSAKEERFEEAKRIRGQIFALRHINDVSLIKDEYRAMGTSSGSYRIEAYDAAHLAGTAAVGVMTVVEEGLPKKADYRMFKLRNTKEGDDMGAVKEVLSRRLGHAEWPMPKLIVVDGATAQINAAKKVLNEAGVDIPVVGVVKDEKHRPKEIRGEKGTIADREREILLANAEAHRFAIGFHRKRSRRSLV